MLIVVASSCNKVEDGAYSPKEKISKIYEDSWDGEKMLSSVWNWDGKKLKSIDYYWNDQIEYTEYYTYNKDGRIESVVDQGYDEAIRYEYDGNYLSKAAYYEDGELCYEYDFVYDENKISEIGYIIDSDYLYKKSSKKMRFEPLSVILPQVDMSKVEKLAREANVVRGFDVRIPIKLEWDGDNVSKMSMLLTVDEYTVGMTMEYKFDDKINPLKNFLTLYPEESINYTFCKNNVVEMTMTEFEGTDVDTEKVFIVYEYDGKYPIVMNADGDKVYFEYE